MKYETIDISMAILDLLKDAEYHSITATTLHVAKYLHLTPTQMNEQLESRKSNNDNIPLTKKKIYNQTVIGISHLRKAKFLKDFPKTKSIGFFVITEKGLNLLQKNKNEVKIILNSELNKYHKTKKPN